MDPVNLFAAAPADLPQELVERLATGRGVRIERIVSRGHCSPPDEWYDQAQCEWVVLLRGRARLVIAGRPAPIELGPGDSLLLPAHCRHRVDWTDPDQDCVWLAVFFDPAD